VHLEHAFDDAHRDLEFLEVVDVHLTFVQKTEKVAARTLLVDDGIDELVFRVRLRDDPLAKLFGVGLQEDANHHRDILVLQLT